MDEETLEVDRELDLRAADLVREFNNSIAMMHYERMRKLDTPSAKLVYVYTWHHEPQSFMGIKRTLGMSKSTLSRALDENLKNELMIIDTNNLYWISRKGLGENNSNI